MKSLRSIAGFAAAFTCAALLYSTKAEAQFVYCSNGGSITLPTDGTYSIINRNETCNSIETLSSFSPTGFHSLYLYGGGQLDYFINRSTTASPSGNEYILNYGGSIDRIDNYGSMVGDIYSGIRSSTEFSPANSSYIGTINNYQSALIKGDLAGIENMASTSGLTATIDSIVNHGDIQGTWGIYNRGVGASIATINEIVNYGSINGTSVGILNLSGRIVNFHTASAVTIQGNLPENYYVIIRGANDYGRMEWVSGFANSTTMRFGVSSYSTGLSAGTYSAVISNVASSAVDAATRSGTVGRYAWELLDADNDNSWDLTLRWLGSDPTNTLSALRTSAGAVRGVLSGHVFKSAQALDYDCSTFDRAGLCVSIGARSTLGSHTDGNETAGLLTVAYRITPELRIGGFIDQAPVRRNPTGITQSGSSPMFGAFVVSQQSSDFSGLRLRAAVAFQRDRLSITRSVIDDTEPGSGKADLLGMAFGAEVSYGLPVHPGWIAQPYASVRRSETARSRYTESASSDVEFPITYDRFGQYVTSTAAGFRLHGTVTPKVGVVVGAGIEYDLISTMDRYSGTSGITGLEGFSIDAREARNRLRPTASLGMRFAAAPNRVLTLDAAAGTTPYQRQAQLTTLVRYAVGF